MADSSADDSAAGGEQEPSFYAVLNVPRDASAEDIKRAYKGLAQVFHPDKHLDDELRSSAQAAFAKLNEAYEVLSDPSKRDVYDVYGKEGLAAGLSLGTKLKSTEELRREWEAFRAQQRRAREEALATHRGTYICRIDGRGWAHGDLATTPAIRMVVVQNSLDVGVGDADVALLQGQAALKGNAGSGSVVAGYKRTLSPLDALEVNAVLGLRSLLTVTSTRQLGSYTTAALSASYSPGQGVGMQVTTSRQVTAATSASLTWVLGPSPGSAMVFSLTHRGSRYVISGRLDLGLVTSLSGRVTYQFSEQLSVKLAGRCGTSGIDGELGLARRFSPGNILYAGSVVSYTGGTHFKLRYSRAGQVFEFPILLTSDVGEWQLFAAATVLPPLSSWLLLRFVVRPIRAWSARRRDKAQWREQAEQLRAAAARARAERALLAPVARRKASAEAAAGGLVILEAAYGVLHEYRLARAAGLVGAGSGSERQQQQQQQQQQHQQQEALSAAAQQQQQQQQRQQQRRDTQPDPDVRQQQQPASAGSRPAKKHKPAAQQQQQSQPEQQAAGAPAANGDAAAAVRHDGGAEQQHGDGSGSGSSDVQLPPQWLDVTEALQYLVSGGKLELHGGVSKLGLMGFADVAPGTDKELYVAYCHNRQLYEKVVGDGDLLRLPGAGEPVCEEAVASRLWEGYRRDFTVVGGTGAAGSSSGGGVAGPQQNGGV